MQQTQNSIKNQLFKELLKVFPPLTIYFDMKTLKFSLNVNSYGFMMYKYEFQAKVKI